MKERCEVCKRLLRKCKLYTNKLTKQIVCKRCNEKIGSNPFYSSKKSERISNFSMTETEKKVLANKKGWARVNAECNGLKTIKRRIQWNKKMKRDEEKVKQSNKQELKRKFIEGLK